MNDARSERRIAQDLLDIGAVTFSLDEPFKWASGLRSPIYCDNRLTIGYPAVRRRIRDAFVEHLRRDGRHPDLVAGTATAGIPHAAWLAESLDLPMIYVRSKPKGHGKGSRIEGPITSGQRVVVIEDLISTGGSSIGVVEALRREDLEIIAVLAIFSYELREAETAFAALEVPLITLTNFNCLFEVARVAGMLDDREIESITSWSSNPRRWTEDCLAREGRL
jgi:orotate phosphoribosyltransferase